MPEERPPSPIGARSYDELSQRLRQALAWAGLTHRELHRRVRRLRTARGAADLPAYNTVYRCLLPGRKRLDVELVVDIAAVLLGMDVAAEWRQAHRVITGHATEAAVISVADHLPAPDGGFVGRQAQLRRILDAEPDAAGVWAISGMAGVGKTRFASEVARLLAARGRFADVRLVVNLRGFDADRPAADPAAVLEGFLRRLGASGSEIGCLTLAGRSALFRRLLDGRRALILLDNAASVDQVLPLLPDLPTCLVLVTSRRRLTGLDTARHVALDVFTPEESVELLRDGIGDERVDAERGEAADIIELVGRLPLALALLTRRLAASDEWTMADHRDRLADLRTMLRLDDGVEVALRTSYDELAEADRVLLGLLAIYPGRDFDDHAAAALAGVEVGVVRRQLDDLVAANMITARASRFELHDLVRVFAEKRVRESVQARMRRAAAGRLLDFQLATARAALVTCYPHEAERWEDLPTPAARALVFDGADEAMAWLDTERVNLVVASGWALNEGRDDHVTRLACVMTSYFEARVHVSDAQALFGNAVRVASGVTRGHVLNGLAMTHWQRGDAAEALVVLEEAIREFSAAGASDYVVNLSGNVGLLLTGLGDYRAALPCFRRAMEFAVARNNESFRARQLCNIGLAEMRLGNYPAAVDNLSQALAVTRASADHLCECRALDGLGTTFWRMGKDTEAGAHYEQALAVARQSHNRADEGKVLNHLGVLLVAAGRFDEALAHHRQAIELAREIGGREGMLAATNDMAAALLAAGRTDDAVRCLRQSIDSATAADSRYELARAQSGLGDALSAAGDPVAARKHWRTAHAAFTEMGVPEAVDVHERLVSAATVAS
ncbi:tetratricopeptide repeat protein [Amycolatopsis roodepoortensis]|uniref:tetratricopeptide repeat protein n=1 Tax=Amycolatopsis roodepoortensis TaxID=700274 RepID=UPI00214B573D|nr:tetratricopeptide repeat protein [Amycolatopsis roodepoortensis]UUV30777.1 tetratricopeptide repeat protein [Amycolatopsis roodepoortensis]